MGVIEVTFCSKTTLPSRKNTVKFKNYSAPPKESLAGSNVFNSLDGGQVFHNIPIEEGYKSGCN